MILLGLCVPNTISLTEEEKMGYCNSLALIKEDGESSQKLKKLSELYFLKLECTEDDACNFCDITPQPQEPGTPPPSKQGMPTDSCVKPQSFTCPVTTLEQTPTQQAGRGRNKSSACQHCWPESFCESKTFCVPTQNCSSSLIGSF